MMDAQGRRQVKDAVVHDKFDARISDELSNFSHTVYVISLDLAPRKLTRRIPGQKTPQRVANTFALRGKQFLQGDSLSIGIEPLVDQGSYLSVEDFNAGIGSENIYLTLYKSILYHRPIRLKPKYDAETLSYYIGQQRTDSYEVHAVLRHVTYTFGELKEPVWQLHLRVRT